MINLSRQKHLDQRPHILCSRIGDLVYAHPVQKEESNFLWCQLCHASSGGPWKGLEAEKIRVEVIIIAGVTVGSLSITRNDVGTTPYLK